MLGYLKKKCTEETIGTIVKKKWNGELWFIKVEYMVNGKVYRITEQLTYHVTKTYRIGPMPIGTCSMAAIENINEGVQVRVMYNPNNPKRGYLPDNNGWHII